jgi:hypothetical protein
VPSTDLDKEVRSKLFQLMVGLVSLRDFQRWFAPIAWRLGDARPDEHRLARRVELRLAEYTSGGWSRQQLLRELDLLLRASAGGVRPPTGGAGLGGTRQASFRRSRWYSGTPVTSSS